MRERLEKSKILKDAMVKFGQDSGLFDNISVVSVRTKVNDRPFAIQVKKGDSIFYIDELGFGVGQILPIIADISFSRVRMH